MVSSLIDDRFSTAQNCFIKPEIWGFVRWKTLFLQEKLPLFRDIHAFYTLRKTKSFHRTDYKSVLNLTGFRSFSLKMKWTYRSRFTMFWFYQILNFQSLSLTRFCWNTVKKTNSTGYRGWNKLTLKFNQFYYLVSLQTSRPRAAQRTLLKSCCLKIKIHTNYSIIFNLGPKVTTILKLMIFFLTFLRPNLIIEDKTQREELPKFLDKWFALLSFK